MYVYIYIYIGDPRSFDHGSHGCQLWGVLMAVSMHIGGPVKGSCRAPLKGFGVDPFLWGSLQ